MASKRPTHPVGSQVPLRRVEQPQRLEGDDLYTWARLMADVDHAQQQAQGFAQGMAQKYKIRQGMTINPAGFIVPEQQMMQQMQRVAESPSIPKGRQSASAASTSSEGAEGDPE